MKRLGVISLLAVAGFCTAGVAKAQDHQVRATVPFDFVVGSKHLPAGNYQFLQYHNRTTMLIRNDNQQIFVLTTADDMAPINSKPDLVFHKYGNNYFLREIHCPNIAVNADFPQSKQERQLGQNVARLDPDTVLLALNSN